MYLLLEVKIKLLYNALAHQNIERNKEGRQYYHYHSSLFLNCSQELVNQLREFSPKELGRLMGVSPKLAELNFTRYAQWHLPFTQQNSSPAILSFAGDVYEGLQAHDFTTDELLFANDRIFILSGLYDILRVHDLMQSYRLEMGTMFDILNRYSTLYELWGNRITEFLKEHVETIYVVNLAS